MEDQLFRAPSSGQCSHLIFQLFFGHQVLLILFHLHSVSQSPRRTRDDRDLCHRRGIGLECRNERMPDLMIGHDQLLFVGEHAVLLLVSCDDCLDTFFQVSLGDELPVLSHRPEGRLIYHIGQLRAGSAGSRPCDGIKVHIIA